jgi:glycosyltransferase involved in cell wall biosynthesis
MNHEYRLAIILPIYNPPENWGNKLIHTLNELEAELGSVAYSLVIVNDGSTKSMDDHIIERIQDHHKNVIYHSYLQNKGKGHAVRFGLSKTEADFYIYTDFDFPFGYHAIRDTLEILMQAGTNLVIGKRGKEYFSVLPFKRRLISGTLRSINYLITGFKIVDTQAGLKGLDNQAKEVFLSTHINGFIFELEFLQKCLRNRLTYQFIDVKPREDIVFSDFGFNTIKREIVNFIKVLFGS